jgi:hypothetical protein
MYVADRKIKLASSLIASGDRCIPERRVASELEITLSRPGFLGGLDFWES